MRNELMEEQQLVKTDEGQASLANEELNLEADGAAGAELLENEEESGAPKKLPSAAPVALQESPSYEMPCIRGSLGCESLPAPLGVRAVSPAGGNSMTLTFADPFGKSLFVAQGVPKKTAFIDSKSGQTLGVIAKDGSFTRTIYYVESTQPLSCDQGSNKYGMQTYPYLRVSKKILTLREKWTVSLMKCDGTYTKTLQVRARSWPQGRAKMDVWILGGEERKDRIGEPIATIDQEEDYSYHSYLGIWDTFSAQGSDPSTTAIIATVLQLEIEGCLRGPVKCGGSQQR